MSNVSMINGHIDKHEENNPERDRLVELLDDGCKNVTFHDKRRVNEQVADHLLANGVIVPLVNVGDVVYEPIITDDTHEPAIWDITITQISIEIGKLLNDCYAIGTICKSESGESFDFSDIGKTVFLTRAEAKEALSKLQASKGEEI